MNRGVRLGDPEACGRGVLGVLLGTLLRTDPACASFVCALHAVAALAVAAPPLDRAVMSPILTSSTFFIFLVKTSLGGWSPVISMALMWKTEV